jgi:hypothetical protein
VPAGRTADHARGLRLYPWALTNILRVLREEGFSRAHIYTTGSNVASQRGIVRAGFSLSHTLNYVQFGPWRTAGRTQAPAALHPRLSTHV